VPIVFYPALIERGRRGFGVFFPDVPSRTSAGEPATEAALNAEEALARRLHKASDNITLQPSRRFRR
jgi:predicted RNase H-like HicB family nuclease